MSSRTPLRARRGRYDWITASLLISLSPIALILGILFAMSDSISRVVGHRGKLVPLVTVGRKRNPPSHTLQQPNSARRTILITGASPIALALAREFTFAGHRVIVVDEEIVRGLNRARYSRGVSQFIAYDKANRSVWGSKLNIELAYPQQVLNLVTAQNADVWIACDNWSTDEEKMQAAGVVKLHRPDCLVPFPGPESLDLAWNKFAFSKFVKSLETGIITPASTVVRSRGQIHSLLGAKDSKRSILITGPLPRGTYSDEFVRNYSWRDSGFSDYSSTTGSIVDSLEPDEELLQRSYHLPLKTLDVTYDLLSNLPISPVSPWDATEIIQGQPCIVHALVHNSICRVFAGVVLRDPVQYPPTYQSIHDQYHRAKDEALSALDPTSSLHSSLINFTELFASKLPAQSLINLTLKFVLVSKATNTGVELRPWVVDCEYDLANTLLAVPDAVALWTSTITRLGQKTLPKRVIATPTFAHQYENGTYSAPTTLLHAVLVPIWLFVTGKYSLSALLRSWLDFVHKVFHWREELWSAKDPAPFLWFWAVESPIIMAIRVLWNILIALRLVAA